ncbi:LLM class flavin-dependent oxidoreductase [Echinicola strongylocentroti]|uniref:Luciferase-like monooxygenase n=1 Tax=Echinicola strongylocentroti TaxID=1795355 RepID=A0A2Z4IS11_9BACT|nr:LLM class flavin-dependent oxidoreductase [Echinicola strongylocentroti]AWW33093.1 LLM class flavin-dependent oxidoreductase [Echinicola strongylocentroti]
MKNIKPLGEIAFSVLDLAIIKEQHDATDAFARSLGLAKHAEKWGYKRFWLAEHHNMVSVGSSATAVLIGHIAGGTKSIRVGSGGIMLPNHAPLMVAEQFGTLASLYPERIDLGLGRAPGTDQTTARALRRDRLETVEEFPRELEELQLYLSDENIDGKVRAIPGEGLDIPIYLLGSSMSSAVLAAKKGLPYAFASHFAPAQFLDAVRYYRDNFQPSEYLKHPHVISCVNVIAAETDKEAHKMATSFYQMALGIVRRKSYPLRPPVDTMDGLWTEAEAAAINQMMACSFVGSAATVREDLEHFQEIAQVDEIMICSHIYDHEARLKSYELAASCFREPANAR